MLLKLKKYFLRFIACTMFVTLIGSIAFGLRTAILEHDPIVISMNSKFAQEQTVKIYYSNKDVEKYNDSDMQEFHVKAGESNSRFELSNVDKITYLKFSFDRNVGITELSNIKILGKETYSLSNLAKIIPEQIDNFEIRGNSLIISSSSVNPSIRYSDKVNVSSYSYVWGIPINIYTTGLMLLTIFVCFWWLLSVISLINKDIADSFVKETQF